MNGSYSQQSHSYGGYHPTAPAAQLNSPMLRRRNLETTALSPPSNGKTHPSPKTVVKKLDFMFPKVDTEYTIRSDIGGIASLAALVLIAILVLAESWAWMSQNWATTEHVLVDQSLGKRMTVNLNMTFPGLACEDLHLDVMDVAGDSQISIEDTMIKQRLTRYGQVMGQEEIVKSNRHRQDQEAKEKLLKDSAKPPENYCGPCFGAGENETACCNTCDDLVAAYETKKWRTDVILLTSEQCIREGRDKQEPKRMKKGEGCNLSGSMTVNRVAGNFHIAMGEGIERDGRHIHTFLPEDTPNFNASHIIHHLSFGTSISGDKGESTLNGVTKIVTKEYGTTGLFQYFIKIVPTTYVTGANGRAETNRYFFTERFRPLMQEYFEGEDDDDFLDIENSKGEKAKKKAVNAGHKGGHSNHEHHHVRNAILPGVFFIYEIYPFAVEISPNSVPFTHLLIRIMATCGGVFTMGRWADSLIERYLRRRRNSLSYQ